MTRVSFALLVAAIAVTGLGRTLQATVYYTPQGEGFTFSSSDTVESDDGYVVLSLDPDYTLLAYNWVGPGDPYLIWSSKSDNNWPTGYGTHIGQTSFSSQGIAAMQGDGNFVVYDTSSNPWVPLWATNTTGNDGSWLSVQGDTNMVIVTPSHVPVWSLF